MFITGQFFATTKRVTTLTLTIAFLTNCSGSSHPSATPEHLGDLSNDTMHDSFRGATAPLDDFGLREDDIPAVLQVAVDKPYATQEKFNCPAIKAEIAQLNAVLGPDVDAPRADKESPGFAMDSDTILDRGEEFAHDSLVDFVKAQTSILPFRSAIRTITGANHHKKEISRAELAGRLRRAYLKGMLQMSPEKCVAPAIAPTPHIEEAGLFSFF